MLEIANNASLHGQNLHPPQYLKIPKVQASPYILAIESSCDETAVAIFHSSSHSYSQKLFSQVALHEQFGGVVPELASRDHAYRLIPLIHELLREENLRLEDIGCFAYTCGPGLVGPLLVGASCCFTLARVMKRPVYAIDHMEAHLLSALLEEPQIQFPFCGLLISGGHTEWLLAQSLGSYQRLGESLDDALGEVFDKVARMLGLPYPGGKELEQLARGGDPLAYQFPQPLAKKNTMDMSLSGLKSHIQRLVLEKQEKGLDTSTKANIAASFQYAIGKCLETRLELFAKKNLSTSLCIGGGVAANSYLRERLSATAKSLGIRLYWPRLELCTDNAVMVAFCCALKLKHGIKPSNQLVVNPNQDLCLEI